MDMIGYIYSRAGQPSERTMRKNKQYAKSKNQISQYYKNLCETLSKNEKSVLDKLLACYDTKIDIVNKYCFKSGFKTALTVAFQSLYQ